MVRLEAGGVKDKQCSNQCNMFPFVGAHLLKTPFNAMHAGILNNNVMRVEGYINTMHQNSVQESHNHLHKGSVT